MKSMDTVNFYQLLMIFARKWKFFLIISLIFFLAGLAKFTYFPVYPGVGKLIIKDFNNSQLQYSLVQHLSVEEDKKSFSDNRIQKLDQVEALLNSHHFYVLVSKKLYEQSGSNKKNLLSDFFNNMNLDINHLDFIENLADNLELLSSFKVQENNVIQLEVKTSSRELTFFLVNEILLSAKDTLIQTELLEVVQAEKYLSDEIDKKKRAIEFIEKNTFDKLSKKQIISYSSEKNDIISYINDTKRIINNLKIDIATIDEKILQKTIQDPEYKKDDKFSHNNQIISLNELNRTNKIKLKTYQTFLEQYEARNNRLLPLEYEIENQNAIHQLEYKIFASLKESVAKIGLQKLYVKNKIAILEYERLNHIKAKPGLMTLILASQVLALSFCVILIYLYELFKADSKFYFIEEASLIEA